MTHHLRLLVAPAVAAVLLVAAPAAGAAGVLPPSLTVDTTFAPPSGIAKFDFVPGTTATDQANGTAIDGDRMYTVGETRDTNGDSNMGIIARRGDGTLDPGFSGDGQLSLPIAAAGGRDVAAAVLVLPDHRLRILGGYDADPGSGTNLDVAVAGLMPDGSLDRSWGGDGIVTFPVGAGNDNANRMVLDGAGRLVITGSYTTTIANTTKTVDHTFVAALDAAGHLVPGFGTGGVRTLDRAGGTPTNPLNDRGIDIALRPGGGYVAVLQVETDPGSAFGYIAVLHAFAANGSDDRSFGTAGERVLTVGDPDTTPGAILGYGGMLWVTGSTKHGADTDAFLARTDGNGNGLQSRSFDMRGTSVPADQAVTSQGLDMTVLPGLPDTLVVGGSVTTSQGTDWGAAAFNGIEGDLASAGYGDIVLATPGQGAIVGLVTGPGWIGVAGSMLDLSNTGTSTLDSSYGNAKLFVDADKSCDLALDIVHPLEVVFHGRHTASLDLSVTNHGTKTCGGDLSVPAPYSLTYGGRSGSIATGPVVPGATFAANGVTLTHAGSLLREDVLKVSLAAPADVGPTDNSASVSVRFAYCDLALRRVGRVGSVPTEGSRRFEFTVRNVGTAPCRGVRLGVARGGRRTDHGDRYAIDGGRSVADDMLVDVSRGGRAGARKRLRLRVTTRSEDVFAGNDTVKVAPRLVRVGDSRIRRKGARRFSGTASRGHGKLRARRLRVKRVDVAVLRHGHGCRWLASASGRMRKVRAGRKGKCTRRVWVRAHGRRHWHLKLRKRLPRGRYTVLSRTTIAAGFREASFSRKDRNKFTFRVR